jgi:hypothetical protein
VTTGRLCQRCALDIRPLEPSWQVEEYSRDHFLAFGVKGYSTDHDPTAVCAACWVRTVNGPVCFRADNDRPLNSRSLPRLRDYYQHSSSSSVQVKLARALNVSLMIWWGLTEKRNEELVQPAGCVSYLRLLHAFPVVSNRRSQLSLKPCPTRQPLTV